MEFLLETSPPENVFSPTQRKQEMQRHTSIHVFYNSCTTGLLSERGLDEYSIEIQTNVVNTISDGIHALEC